MADVHQTAPAPIWPDSINEHWKLFLIEGIVLIALGAAALAIPVLATLAIAIFLGWLLLIGGTVGAVTTLMHRQAPGFWWSLLSAIVTIVAGTLLVGWPVNGAVSLTVVLGAYLFAEGVASMMLAYRHRGQGSRRWGWLFLNGALDIFLAGLIAWLLPAIALWVLGIIVGIDFVFGGAALIAMALEARQAA